jgi:hypothetical protein
MSLDTTATMKVGVIGDVHGDFSTIERIMKANF